MHWIFQNEENKPKIFVYVPDDGKNADKYNESDYTFEVYRVRDEETNLVSLKIMVTIESDGDTVKVPFVSSISELDSTLKSMCNYGIVFTDKNSQIKLKKAIMDNYKKLDQAPEERENKEKLDAVLDAVCDFIISDNQANADEYHVPVGIFNELASDCEYASYEIKKLRKDLAREVSGRKPYIRKVGKRYAIMVNYRNKATRVIAFQREPLAEKIAEKVKLLKDADADNQEVSDSES